MKNRLTASPIVAFIALLLSFHISQAQSPGLIVRPAGGGTANSLNPDGNAYSSTTSAGFVSNDITESEIAYKVVPPAITEPTGDLATGPSGGFTDIVKTVDNSGFYVYSNGTNLFFRLRIGGIISGSKGYSILIDTDGKMGNTGPNADPNYVAPTNTSNGNPGFEYEVVYETNFQVEVFNVNGTQNPVSAATYSLTTNSQISVALSTDGNNADYFYDWFVPLSAIGSPTSIRMAATTVTSPSSALQGSRSDIYGIDDRNTTIANAWTSVVNAQSAITVTGSGISSVGAVCTAAPVVNSPVTPGSNVSITGTWTSMDASKPTSATITLYKNGAVVTTTTVTSGNTWTITVPTVASGDVFYAKAQASGESMCLQSNNVTAGCSTTLSSTVLTQSSSKGICGSLTTGATGALIYKLDANGVTLMNASNANMTYTANTFTWFSCSGGSGNVANGTYMIILTGTGCNSAPVFDCISNGSSSLSGLSTNTGITFPSAIYPYQTSITGSVPTYSGVQSAALFINNVYKTSVSIAANTTSYTFNNLSLTTGDNIKIYLSGNGCTVYNSTSVSCYTQPPLMTTASGSLVAGATSISGTSTSIGATVTLYKGTSPSGTSVGTATVNSSGAWTITTSALVSGDSYYARQTYNGCTSPSSSAATVAAATTVCATIGATSYISSASSVGGTISTSFAGSVKLYLDGTLIGNATLNNPNSGTWSIPVNTTYANTLYAGGLLTVNTQATGAVEKTNCNVSASITCIAPALPSITPASSTITVGQQVTYSISNVAQNSWYSLMDNTGKSYATSLYNGSTTSSFNLTTNVLSTAGTYNLKLAADQLTGCGSSYAAASITVNNIALGVHFLQVTAKKTGGETIISWKVANEENISHYQIERSNDGRSFEPVGKKEYEPTLQSINEYSFNDKATSGKTYYRIKEVDKDGAFTYSSIVAVVNNPVAMQLWPNPASSQVTITYVAEKNERASLEIFDVNGKKIRTENVQLTEGTNSFTLENLGSLARGNYLLKFSTPSEVQHHKLILR